LRPLLSESLPFSVFQFSLCEFENWIRLFVGKDDPFFSA